VNPHAASSVLSANPSQRSRSTNQHVSSVRLGCYKLSKLYIHSRGWHCLSAIVLGGFGYLPRARSLHSPTDKWDHELSESSTSLLDSAFAYCESANTSCNVLTINYLVWCTARGMWRRDCPHALTSSHAQKHRSTLFYVYLVQGFCDLLESTRTRTLH